MGSSHPNTKKGRSKIPSKPGAYNLKDRNGHVVYTGMTKDLNRRVKEHHYDKSMHFAKVSITPTKTKSSADKIEDRRLKSRKPPQNKKRS